MTSAYADANKGNTRRGNMNDNTPESVGVVDNHLTIRTDDQNMTAPVITLIQRWKACEVSLVEVCENIKAYVIKKLKKEAFL